MCLSIKEGAIFIADAHEDESKDDLYKLLKKIETKEIKTPQLFLMGDMFDLLVGKVEYGVEKYKKYINLIEKIALDIEVIYLEGNHDFGLKSLFKNVKIYPIQMQPVKGKFEDGTLVYLLHGDKYGDFIHKVYTKLIRSNGLLKVLNFIDKHISNKISKTIQDNQQKKDLCRKINNFNQLIEAKIDKYHVKKNSFIVEGHYHQNFKMRLKKINYINLPSFACNQSYFIVKCFQNEKFAQIN